MPSSPRPLLAAALTASTALLICGAGPAAAKFVPRHVPFQKGMTLSDWGPTGYPVAQTRTKLLELKRNRVTSVTLLQTWNQQSLTSAKVFPGPEAVPDENLVEAIRAARKHGIQVLLRPYVDVLGGHWRGLVRPKDPKAWFRSYGAFEMKYAKIAQKERVSVFVFASEMHHISILHGPEMAALALRIRKVFSGPVIYEANWGNELTDGNEKWMTALDAIGVSAYYPVCGSPTTDVNKLLAGWASAYSDLKTAHEVTGRPVMFTEIGYVPIAHSCITPWSGKSWSKDKVNRTAQRANYEAAFRRWWSVPWFKGFHWWTVANQGVSPGKIGHEPLSGAWDRIKHWYALKPAGI